jgi:hypothetical protein
MVIRSFYVSWAQAVSEGEQLLDNLARWTNLNAIELTNYDADWSPQNREVPSLVFPSGARFRGLGLRLTTKERFDSLQRFMESARSKGFDVVCNFAPLRELEEVRSHDLHGCDRCPCARPEQDARLRVPEQSRRRGMSLQS